MSNTVKRSATPVVETKAIMVRIPRSLLTEIDRELESMRARMRGVTLTRSDAIRALLARATERAA